MAEMTLPKHGEICWRDLATKDLAAAKDFYQKLFGWQLKQSSKTEAEYSEVYVNERGQGGMMQLTGDCGEYPTHWMTYVAVDDIDESIQKIEPLGGKIIMEPTELPNVGRFAIVNDPGGAMFSMISFNQM